MHGLRNNLTVKKAAQVEYLSLKPDSKEGSTGRISFVKALKKCLLPVEGLPKV